MQPPKFYVEFERYVNSKDNQTLSMFNFAPRMFERYVNSKDNQTAVKGIQCVSLFERYVNSKDNQTCLGPCRRGRRLRDM